VAVIQDDASFVALVDPATGLAEAVPLPPDANGRRLFDDSRRNKADKLDHEALISIATGGNVLLVALGSGSTPRRESIALIAGIDTPHPVPRVCPAPQFYAGLRASAPFAGSELNIEGAIYLDGRLRLFGRGNGATRGGVRPVNATCEVEWTTLRAHIEQGGHAPAPCDVVQYELGFIGGARLAFTDATPGWGFPGARSVLYSAAAEASPDATRDGEVAGSAIGVIVEREGETTAQWAELQDSDGGGLVLKAEGIVVTGARGRVLVVVDVDAHDHPSELLEVQLEGPWAGLDSATD
jgi:hypothetical protein